MSGPKTGSAGIVAGLLIVAAASAAADQDGLLYYAESGRVVITNTPSRPDVRPVPGFERVAASLTAAVSAGNLPRTVYDPFIERVARENGLPPALIKAVALVESGFDPHAVSSKGAQGLMQLMPSTAGQYGVRDAFDPLQNLRAGATHLRRLLDEFGGDLTLALAAYNAGSGAVRRHGGVPDYAETRNYVRKVQGKLGRGARRRAAIRRSPPPGSPIRVLREPDGTVKLVN